MAITSRFLRAGSKARRDLRSSSDMCEDIVAVRDGGSVGGDNVS